MMSRKTNMDDNKVVFLMGLLVLSMLVNTCSGEVTCSQAVTQLSSCIGYLVGRDKALTVQCCQAASKLNDMVKTKPEIKGLCFCFKDTASRLQVDVGRAESLPNDCQITVPVPIDPNVDCDKLLVV